MPIPYQVFVEIGGTQSYLAIPDHLYNVPPDDDDNLVYHTVRDPGPVRPDESPRLRAHVTTTFICNKKFSFGVPAIAIKRMIEESIDFRRGLPDRTVRIQGLDWRDFDVALLEALQREVLVAQPMWRIVFPSVTWSRISVLYPNAWYVGDLAVDKSQWPAALSRLGELERERASRQWRPCAAERFSVAIRAAAQSGAPAVMLGGTMARKRRLLNNGTEELFVSPAIYVWVRASPGVAPQQVCMMSNQTDLMPSVCGTLFASGRIFPKCVTGQGELGWVISNDRHFSGLESEVIDMQLQGPRSCKLVFAAKDAHWQSYDDWDYYDPSGSFASDLSRYVK